MSGDRLTSGSAEFDLILGGGLPANGVNLIIGTPGAGKTILAHQYLFNNSSTARPGLYCTTVSEPLEKVLRYGQSLSFFDPGSIGSSVFFEDLSPVLNEEDLGTVLTHLTILLKEYRPSVLVIDSFKALRTYADAGAFRRFAHEFAARLSVLPVNCFWLGEYTAEEAASAPEFAVADAIISLETSQESSFRRRRILEVLKLRGSGFAGGRHAYRLSSHGIEMFHRLADLSDSTTYDLEERRVSSGIPLLDELLVEGYWAGTSTLVAGPSGSGKTLTGLHYIFAGAARGEGGVVATLQENPAQLERTCRGFGWTLSDPSVEVVYRSPVDLYTDEWVYDLLATVDRSGAKRVMVDSLTDIRAAVDDEARFREYMYSLLQRLSRSGVSSILTFEVGELYGVTQLAAGGISHLADNVVLLQFALVGTERIRLAGVLKTRSSAHDSRMRRFQITAGGFVLGDPVAEPL